MLYSVWTFHASRVNNLLGVKINEKIVISKASLTVGSSLTMKIWWTLLAFMTLTFSPCAATQKGSVKYIQGKADILRGIQRITAKVGSGLNAGDILNVRENSQASIELKGTGLLKISARTKFQIPKTEESSERTSNITLFFGSIWIKAKKLIQGDSLEIKTPTATAGVRGTEFGTDFQPTDNSGYELLENMTDNFDSSLYASVQGETEVDVSEGEVEAMDESGNTFAVTPGFSFSAAPSGSRVEYNPVKVQERQNRADATPDDNSAEAKAKAQRAEKAAQSKIEAAKKRAADLAARKAAEAKRKASEEKKRREARKREAERKKKAEEARKKREAEAKKKAEEARKKREAEAKKKAEEARKKREAEAKKKTEEARRKREAEAKKKQRPPKDAPR